MKGYTEDEKCDLAASHFAGTITAENYTFGVAPSLDLGDVKGGTGHHAHGSQSPVPAKEKLTYYIKSLTARDLLIFDFDI